MINPVLALIAWSMVMLVWLYVRRLPALWHYAVTSPDVRTHEAARHLPPQVQWPADNYNNLLEQPTLFYALCLVIFLRGLADPDLEYLAWLYVALRIVHSLVQAVWNETVVRFCLFVSGSAVLGLLCVLALRLAFNA
ncbi:MAG: MAPEG family protein [Asticcacaulis sp.]|nr:MAPEG family protein [Asticcacaulis sp.]